MKFLIWFLLLLASVILTLASIMVPLILSMTYGNTNWLFLWAFVPFTSLLFANVAKYFGALCRCDTEDTNEN